MEASMLTGGSQERGGWWCRVIDHCVDECVCVVYVVVVWWWGGLDHGLLSRKRSDCSNRWSQSIHAKCVHCESRCEVDACVCARGGVGGGGAVRGVPDQT